MQQYSILQSSGWEIFQRNNGIKTVRIPYGGVPVLLIEHPLRGGYSYWYAPHGPSSELESNRLRAWTKQVKEKTLERKPLFIRIDPPCIKNAPIEDMLRQNGFIRTIAQQPEQTVIIDLRQGDDRLLERMEHDMRYAIRVADRRGVTVRAYHKAGERQERFKAFWELFSETNYRHHLCMYEKAYYKNLVELDDSALKVVLFFAEQEGSIIATALIAYCGESAAYLYAGSRAGYGKYNAPSAILWNAFRETRSLHCRSFDLWGVSDTNPLWRGVTAFKRSFGGDDVSYVGTWDYPYHALGYAGYVGARACVQTFRKFL